MTETIEKTTINGQTVYKVGIYIFRSLNDAKAFIETEKKKEESRQRMQKRLEKEERKKEEAYKKLLGHVAEYIAAFPPIKAGRIKQCLLKQVMHKGTIKNRKSLVEEIVDNGGFVKNGRLCNKDGSFFEARDITKTAIDYAAWYAKKAKKMMEAV